MSLKAINELSAFETLTQAGKITGFSVCIEQKGLLIKADGSSRKQQVNLDGETIASLEAFYQGVPSIRYGTFDYTTLKCLVNARVILDRMLHSNDHKK